MLYTDSVYQVLVVAQWCNHVAVTPRLITSQWGFRLCIMRDLLDQNPRARLCWSTDPTKWSVSDEERFQKMSKRSPWPDNKIRSIPDWAQKDTVANGGIGKSEFNPVVNSILMAKSSKNWLQIWKHTLLESSKNVNDSDIKCKIERKWLWSRIERRLCLSTGWLSLQYGFKTSCHRKLREKQSIEK